MHQEIPIELVNFPTQRARFKIVQVFVDGKPYLLCGDHAGAFHSDILADFLQSMGIQFEGLTPPLEGKRFKVAGMGDAEIDPDSKFLQLPYGNSSCYRKGVDKDFNEMLRKMFPDWKF